MPAPSFLSIHGPTCTHAFRVCTAYKYCRLCVYILGDPLVRDRAAWRSWDVTILPCQPRRTQFPATSNHDPSDGPSCDAHSKSDSVDVAVKAALAGYPNGQAGGVESRATHQQDSPRTIPLPSERGREYNSKVCTMYINKKLSTAVLRALRYYVDTEWWTPDLAQSN